MFWRSRRNGELILCLWALCALSARYKYLPLRTPHLLDFPLLAMVTIGTWSACAYAWSMLKSVLTWADKFRKVRFWHAHMTFTARVLKVRYLYLTCTGANEGIAIYGENVFEEHADKWPLNSYVKWHFAMNWAHPFSKMIGVQLPFAPNQTTFWGCVLALFQASYTKTTRKNFVLTSQKSTLGHTRLAYPSSSKKYIFWRVRLLELRQCIVGHETVTPHLGASIE